MTEVNESPVYLSSTEHGLAFLLLRRGVERRGWAKLRGTPAAWVLLSLELAIAHAIHLALVALTAAVTRLIAVAVGVSPLCDFARAGGLFVAGLISVPLLAKALRAPSRSSLFVLQWPSRFIVALACEEVLAVASGARLAGWRAAGETDLRLSKDPVLELRFRVVAFLLCANRLASLEVACIVSALMFAASHAWEGPGPWFTRFICGLGLALRFAGSGGHLVEVVAFHGMHNAAVVAGQEYALARGSVATPPQLDVLPCILFGAVAVYDAMRLGLLPIACNRRPTSKSDGETELA